MCISPNKLADGTLVACRECRICRDNYINDWAGRLIAESKTAKYQYFALLTYGDDKLGEQGKIKAAVLTYSDVQKYFKKLRKRVGKFKYFVVGEYGNKNDRAHWHVVLMTNKPLEKAYAGKNRDRIKKDGVLRQQGDWDHGWSSFQDFVYTHARYCCKYLDKGKQDEIKTSMLQMSKKPPIGTEYFQQVAKQYVDAGLSPQDRFYSFAEIKNKDGKPRKFMLSGVTAENFVKHFVETWQKRYGKSEMDYWDAATGVVFKRESSARPIPASPVIDEYLDKRMRVWCERAEGWRMKWDMRRLYEERQRIDEQEKEEERKYREKYDRPDTCQCPHCVARRAGNTYK